MRNKEKYSYRKIKKQWLNHSKKMSDGWWLKMIFEVRKAKIETMEALQMVANMENYIKAWLETFEFYKKFYDERMVDENVERS